MSWASTAGGDMNANRLLNVAITKGLERRVIWFSMPCIAFLNEPDSTLRLEEAVSPSSRKRVA